MNMDQEMLANHIFDLLCGNLDISSGSVPLSDFVSSEFDEGSACAEGYCRILEAYSRLCERLSVEEWSDEDVETIINAWMDICRHLALKMFEYGLQISGRIALGPHF